ncbi:MAG: hypothetical protein R2738_01495 [Bacteroides graminisolvens]
MQPFRPTGNISVDVYSLAYKAPVAILKEAEQGKWRWCLSETADISELTKAGWRAS